MTFYLHLPTPLVFERDEADGIAAVRCRVGVDLEFGWTYFISAELSPFDPGFEFAFRVLRLSLDGRVQPFERGSETKGLFAEKDRSAILDVICQATRELLRWRKPVWVDRCSAEAYTSHAPVKKHVDISGVFNSCGYKVTEREKWNGHLQWVAILVDYSRLKE